MYLKDTVLLLHSIVLIHTVFGVVQSPPRLLKQPPTGELLFQVAAPSTQNDIPFVIECEAEGEPPPKYRWIKNGKNFNWQDYDDRISQAPRRGTLVVIVPRNEDVGQYQCFAENEWGVATSNSVFIRKYELDSFKSEPITVKEAREGEPYKLTCQPPEGWPKPTAIWMIQTVQGLFRSIHDSRITVDPEGTLWFSNVTKEDESNDELYVCAATSPFRSAFKLGNEVQLRVIQNGSISERNKIAPVQQYVTRKKEIAIQNTRAKLYCIFGGTPLPQTFWYKNGKPLNTTHRILSRNFGKSLDIMYVTQEDEGDYTCEVSNGVGEAKSHTFNLQVLAEAYFTEEPKNLLAAIEETAELHCQASGNPQPQITWTFNGKPLQDAPVNPRRKVSTNSVIIEKLEKNDTGNYGCNATNSLGYVYKDVSVNVLAIAAEIVEPPRNEETIDGRTVTMRCHAQGWPTPQIKWFKDDIELTGRRYTILKSGDLEITNAGFMDRGKYKCYAQNKLSSVNASATLKVRQRTRITTGTGSVNFEVEAGKPAILKCAAQSDEELSLTINWQRNGETINFETEPRFVQMNDYSLAIPKTSKQDSATYTCVASTFLDNATALATLIVQDKPNPPQLTHVMCNSKDAVVTWVPMSDNRSPILNYIIQYNSSFTPNTWDIASDSVPAKDTTYKVKMVPWTNCTFRVIAKNKIGLSLPSESSGVCHSDPDVPHKNPDDVIAQGTELDNLVITWKPLPKIQHHGPGFYYSIWWKKDVADSTWENHTVSKWEQDEYIVTGTPALEKYLAKVIAGNELGQATAPVRVVEGYSGVDVPTESPKNLSLLQVLSPTTAHVSWHGVVRESLRGRFVGYKIQIWTEFDQQMNKMKEILLPNNVTTAIVHDLTPSTRNKIRISAFNGKYNSVPSEELLIITPEGVPSYVQSFEGITLGSSALYLIWKPPSETNGNLIGYKIYYQKVAGTEMGPLLERHPQIYNPNQQRAKLSGLEPNTKYRIHISAATRAGEGEKLFIQLSTGKNSDSPPFKPKFEIERHNIDSNVYSSVKVQWYPCGSPTNETSCSGKSPGSYFYVKYRGATQFDQIIEINDDYVFVRGLKSDQVYEFIVVSVDGNHSTESDAKEVDTSGWVAKVDALANANATSKVLSTTMRNQ